MPQDFDRRMQAQFEATAGEGSYRQGNYVQAVLHLAEAVRLEPQNPTYHLNLASASWRAGKLDGVEVHFQTALSLQPDNAAIHEKMAWWYIMVGRIGQACHHSSTALRLRPDQISCRVTHADVLCAQGEFAQAWNLIKPMLDSGTGGPFLARLYSRLAPSLGKEIDAIATIERELRSPEITRIDKARLHFAAAGLFDGLQQYDAAFEHARLANAADARPFNPDAHSRYVSNLIAFYTREHFDSLPRATRLSKRPLLIIGMARSGTSLVEQILATHPEVCGAGELSYLFEAASAVETAEWAAPGPFPTCWNDLTINRANALVSGYLDRIDATNSTATYVSDKMPQNFLFLGAAQLLLPDCRVIHCVRDPRDTCLSCYFTDFGMGNTFSFNLTHLARFYRDYARLMDHWKKVLDLPILDVKYEDLVADQATETRRMLEFLDLPWNDECLSYHQNKRHVATASRDQIRKPIYSTSVGRWKHYQRHIPELLALNEN
jgi:tetratricopeptide (TPR) repeat protein